MDFLRNIFSKTLFKVASLNGVSILIKILIGFVTSKFVAVFLGPSGMALVGNFRNFLTSVESVGTLGFQNGIVKYVAENKENQLQLRQIITTLFISVLAVVLCIGILLVIFSNQFNNAVFGLKYNFSFLFPILALALPFYIGNIILMSIINGFSDFKKVIYINIIGNCMGLVVTVVLIGFYHIEGALLGIIITPSLLFLVSFFVVNTKMNLLSEIKSNFFDFSVLKNLSSYSLMALASALIGPMVFLAIRNYVIQTVGIEQAGYWEGLSRITSYYFMFITTIISIYFLPKLTVADSVNETKSIFYSYFKGIMPLFVLGMMVIYFLRYFIIKMLFTTEFIPMTDLFFWQLVGDTFKAASMVLGIQFFAKKMTKAFIFSELFSLVVLYCSSIYCVQLYGVEGVVIAHAFTFLIYLITLLFLFRKSLF